MQHLKTSYLCFCRQTRTTARPAAPEVEAAKAWLLQEYGAEPEKLSEVYLSLVHDPHLRAIANMQGRSVPDLQCTEKDVKELTVYRHVSRAVRGFFSKLAVRGGLLEEQRRSRQVVATALFSEDVQHVAYETLLGVPRTLVPIAKDLRHNWDAETNVGMLPLMYKKRDTRCDAIPADVIAVVVAAWRDVLSLPSPMEKDHILVRRTDLAFDDEAVLAAEPYARREGSVCLILCTQPGRLETHI